MHATQYANFWSELSNANNRGRSHDAWIMLVSSFIGDGVRARAFQNLTSLVALDTRLGWSGLLPILRDTVLLYDSEVRRDNSRFAPHCVVFGPHARSAIQQN